VNDERHLNSLGGCDLSEGKRVVAMRNQPITIQEEPLTSVLLLMCG
jgi:hypothetical protein